MLLGERNAGFTRISLFSGFFFNHGRKLALFLVAIRSHLLALVGRKKFISFNKFHWLYFMVRDDLR